MIQKFDFTTAAMAAALEETPVTYEELDDIEREFEDAETEIIRQQVQLNKSLYAKRTKIISQIPNFWPLVIEQAPPDIDEYIQPSDSALLLSCLTSLSVSHFEIENGGSGDPRSIAIRWEFSQNDYFEDTVIEKKFWHRRAKDGWTGLVSEPVDIRWKKGKDLTAGLLGLVKRVWDEEQAMDKKGSTAKAKKNKELTAEQRALKKKIENTGLGGISFFAWFGFIGRRVSAEESRLANEKDRERKRLRQENRLAELLPDEIEAEIDEKAVEADPLEIFPDGDSLAVAISEDLWPGAIKYFTQAQEQDALSDDEFESGEEEEEEEEASDSSGLATEERPAKKRKA